MPFYQHVFCCAWISLLAPGFIPVAVHANDNNSTLKPPCTAEQCYLTPRKIVWPPYKPFSGPVLNIGSFCIRVSAHPTRSSHSMNARSLQWADGRLLVIFLNDDHLFDGLNRKLSINTHDAIKRLYNLTPNTPEPSDNVRLHLHRTLLYYKEGLLDGVKHLYSSSNRYRYIIYYKKRIKKPWNRFAYAWTGVLLDKRSPQHYLEISAMGFSLHDFLRILVSTKLHLQGCEHQRR